MKNEQSKKRNLLNILAVKQSGLIYEQYQAIFLQTDFWEWFFFVKLEVQLVVRYMIILTAHETWWYNLSCSLCIYGPIECLVDHQLP